MMVCKNKKLHFTEPTGDALNSDSIEECFINDDNQSPLQMK